MGSTKVKIIDAAEETKPTKAAKTEKAVKETAIPAAKKKNEKISKRASKKTAPKKVRSKKYLAKAALVDKDLTYPLNEAIELAKKTSYTKFAGALEIHINTVVKNVRGLTTLPFAAGKKLKVTAFGKDAEKSGADVVGDEVLLKELQKGRINFDVMVATPAWMPRIVPLAKILGPRGLMPNPKNGTVTENLAKTVAELRGGKTEYKTEKDRNVIHMSIGKVEQESAEISANVKALYATIGKSKIKKIVLSPTMGMGVKVSLNSI